MTEFTFDTDSVLLHLAINTHVQNFKAYMLDHQTVLTGKNFKSIVYEIRCASVKLDSFLIRLSGGSHSIRMKAFSFEDSLLSLIEQDLQKLDETLDVDIDTMLCLYRVSGWFNALSLPILLAVAKIRLESI
jgi:hypothetical protein